MCVCVCLAVPGLAAACEVFGLVEARRLFRLWCVNVQLQHMASISLTRDQNWAPGIVSMKVLAAGRLRKAVFEFRTPSRPTGPLQLPTVSISWASPQVCFSRSSRFLGPSVTSTPSRSLTFAGRPWVLVRVWPHRSGLCPSQEAPLATPRDGTREPLVGKVAPASLSTAPSYPLAFVLQAAPGSPRHPSSICCAALPAE